MNAMFDQALPRCAANYHALSPLSFLERTARVYPDYVAVVYGERQLTYAQLLKRCEAFAAFLDGRGLGKGDVVSVMLPNIPEMVELSHSAASSGRVLHTINTRLDAAAIRFQLEHAESKVLVYDREYSSTIACALTGMVSPPFAIEVVDPVFKGGYPASTHLNYETVLQQAGEGARLCGPEDEWDAIALSYTSGTTGNPKGVVTHHRGAYLNTMANTVAWSMPSHPVYVWVLPMFHCNGWCFPWTITLLAGTHLCLRKVDPLEILHIANKHRATHFCAAPVVLSMLAGCAADGLKFAQRVHILTAGAAPSAAVVQGVEQMNTCVTQVYGMTETFSSTVVSAWRTSWDELPAEERSQLKARAGVQYPACEALDVVTPELTPVPWDSETVGEVVVRGNTVMRGYLKNEAATLAALEGGWFHTGDLAVRDPDGYIVIRDRTKDMINSGGEKMSSLEIEEIVSSHPAVFEVAVVAAPDAIWGEVPWAYVNLKPGQPLSAEELKAFCVVRLARFKVPKQFIFGPLERTATGKVQKFKLRERARLAAGQS